MMNARAAYFACVDFLDEMIGDFLALLQRDGLLDNTIIVYTSDHGEMAGEHGLFWKNTWHEASARVPLIVSTPAQRSDTQPAREVTTPVSLADLFPTSLRTRRHSIPSRPRWNRSEQRDKRVPGRRTRRKTGRYHRISGLALGAGNRVSHGAQ